MTLSTDLIALRVVWLIICHANCIVCSFEERIVAKKRELKTLRRQIFAEEDRREGLEPSEDQSVFDSDDSM